MAPDQKYLPRLCVGEERKGKLQILLVEKMRYSERKVERKGTNCERRRMSTWEALPLRTAEVFGDHGEVLCTGKRKCRGSLESEAGGSRSGHSSRDGAWVGGYGRRVLAGILP